MATLFILESGITKGSEVTKKWVSRPYLMFFVRKNANGTVSMINALDKRDVLTTSLATCSEPAENGYMKITTQNSVIHITPVCFNEGRDDLFIHEILNIISMFNIKGEEIDPDDISYLPNCLRDISGGTGEKWIDCTTFLYKTEKGIIIHNEGFRTENGEETFFDEAKFYPIKIGGQIHPSKSFRDSVTFASDNTMYVGINSL